MKKLIPFKRKREGKTNYKKRLSLLTSGKPRLVVRKSLKNILAQIIEFHPDGDKVLASAHSKDLIKMGWKGYGRNVTAAYLVGLLCGKRAQNAGVKEAILDLGFYQTIKGSVIYAALKGAVDSGLIVPHSEKVFPAEERIAGEHLTKGQNLKKNFEEVKNKILKAKK
jgi:large subunit ribosomal protein L18